MLKFTLVIPVFNEESLIKDCLDAIAQQTVAPDEVIIVDNNCTDNTIEIAKGYPLVRVVKESRQGRGWARSAGFNAAKGDIIGRIDADSRIARNWVEVVKKNFENDTNLYGVTGLGITDMLPFNDQIKGKLMSRSYYWFVHAGFNTITMWGANMAIRKSAWEQVKSEVCSDDKIVHEDQDISLCMASAGLKIKQDNSLLITTNGQTYRYFPKLLHYESLFKSTKKRHVSKGTFNSAKLSRLGLMNTLPGRVFALLLGIPFFIVSFISYPIDLYFIHRHNRRFR